MVTQASDLVVKDQYVVQSLNKAIKSIDGLTAFMREVKKAYRRTRKADVPEKCQTLQAFLQKAYSLR